MCLDALDGKYIVIEVPQFSGSEFYNYKGIFSIVIFAIVDAKYNFIYVNVGCQGRILDSGVFNNTGFKSLLENNYLNLPEKAILSEREIVHKYFPLTSNIMKPSSKHQDKETKSKIFNYRLSHARRVVENVFGIQSSVFQVLLKLILLEPEKVEKVVLTCVYLHTFLRKYKTKNSYNLLEHFMSKTWIVVQSLKVLGEII